MRRPVVKLVSVTRSPSISRITSVDAANRRFRYATLPGWADPVTFAADASPTDIYRLSTLVFRNGQVVPGTSRIALQGVSAQTIDLVQDGSPWSQPLSLASILPGDTAVVASRAGGSPVLLWHVDQSTLSRVTVRGAGSWAVNVLQSSNTIVERVRVEPRPGGLIGSTADGIHFTQSLRNNHIRQCYVTRTMDDALAMDSIAIATVLSQPTARTLTVRRSARRAAACPRTRPSSSCRRRRPASPSGHL
jgi:hypothetical protein